MLYNLYDMIAAQRKPCGYFCLKGRVEKTFLPLLSNIGTKTSTRNVAYNLMVIRLNCLHSREGVQIGMSIFLCSQLFLSDYFPPL